MGGHIKLKTLACRLTLITARVNTYADIVLPVKLILSYINRDKGMTQDKGVQTTSGLFCPHIWTVRRGAVLNIQLGSANSRQIYLWQPAGYILSEKVF